MIVSATQFTADCLPVDTHKHCKKCDKIFFLLSNNHKNRDIKYIMSENLAKTNDPISEIGSCFCAHCARENRLIPVFMDLSSFDLFP